MQKLTIFADCTISVLCCTFRVSLRRRRFRDPVGVLCLRRETKPVRVRCARRVAVGLGERSELRSSRKAPRGDGRATEAKPQSEGGHRRFNRALSAIRHRLSFRGRASSATKRSAKLNLPLQNSLFHKSVATFIHSIATCKQQQNQKQKAAEI